ncbi:MAG TPA: phosphotransferase family protein [Acidimicrobiales bacterium]|nr:phosphotransferase family protein [Acidimicrobiales bacterium]
MRAGIRGGAGGAPDEATALVTRWLEAELGGTVVAISRQARWRPAWFADVRCGNATLAVYVRGERTDMPAIFPLDHEMRMQQLLDGERIPVPRVHGFCPEPRAIVMDRVAGDIDFARSTAEERQAVVDDYVDILARMHAIDVGVFARAGVPVAQDPLAIARAGIEAYERAYRGSKRRPDPFMEFCLQWLARHPPRHDIRPAAVVWDSGQFAHRDGRVVAMLDLELAHVGDPLMDLAGLRMRDTVIGYGDLRAFYRRYEQLSGTPVDLDAIDYHHFAFTFTTQLALHGALADPQPDSDLMNYLQWCSETNLYALEALAGFVGVDLDPVDVPPSQDSPARAAHRHLVRSLRTMEGVDEYGQYRQRIAFRLARHLERVDEIGGAVVARDLDDLGALLGTRPASWAEGELALERFVLDAGPARDAELIRLFQRRLHRQRMLLGPATAAMTQHLPLQSIR